MSIIYEALQETQGENATQAMSLAYDPMTRDDWIDVGIALIIAFLLATMIVAHYPQFNNKSANISMKNNVAINQTNKPALKSEATLSREETAFQLKYILNGVFVSENEKIAMVNNRFFNIGDSIDGMKIINIEIDKITLQNNNSTIQLRVVV